METKEMSKGSGSPLPPKTLLTCSTSVHVCGSPGEVLGGTSCFSNNKKSLQLNPETHSWASEGSRGSLFSISNDTI